jgi:DUF4097 and DUF4098 domain-containing protein YvlB
MVRKLLITAVLASIALVTNGTSAAVGTDPQASQQASQQRQPEVRQQAAADVEVAGGESSQQLTEEFHQVYPLSATGRVSLENINGGVKIKVWDRAAVQVDAIKKAYKRERLNEAKIEVVATEENVKIKTDYPDEQQTFRSGEGRWENPAIVEYALTVPRKAVLESIEMVNGGVDIDGVEGSVKASSINGSVTARGLLGEARLSTINGPLRATFTQLDAAKVISLNSVNGTVTLIIPSDSNASFRAATVHGSISNDFGMQVRHGEYVGHNLDGQIGNGGPRIKLDNVNGGIQINHADDGRTLSPVTSIAVAEKSMDATMAEDISRQVEQAMVAREKIERARVSQAQREAQRQVDAAMRDAQREVEQAQRELQRQQREQARAQAQSRMAVHRTRINSGDQYGPQVSSKETKTFSVSGAPRVTINTFDGHVTIRGWDKPEVTYTATKRANTEESLKQVELQAEQQGQTISIIAKNEFEQNASVHLEVYVPRQSTLHVSSGDGRLSLEGVSGDITLRSGDGPIEVSNSGGQLHVNTGDGQIQISKFDGQVDARTGDGGIALDGNFNALSARTGDGTISLTVPAGSSFTIETNATDGIDNEGFNVSEDVTLSPRMKRWRIGNGGKVFVLRTGEGQILLRPRN